MQPRKMAAAETKGGQTASGAGTSTAATVPKVNSPNDLLSLGQEIKRLIQRKRTADEHLVELEARIYSLETEYFKETGPYGSIMTGLEGYLGLLNGPSTGGMTSSATPSGARKSVYREVKDSARIFSNTSASSRRALMLYNKYSTAKGPQLADDDTGDEAYNRTEGGEDEDILMPSNSSQKDSSSSRKRVRPPPPKKRK